MKMIIPGTKLKNSLIYVGIMLDEKGGHYHLLAKNEDESGLFTWSAAVKPRGKFVCPTSKELHLMRTISKELGMTEFYWSSTEYSNNDVWVQLFGNGDQDANLKFTSYRLRCVRRVDDLTLQALLDGESQEESGLCVICKKDHHNKNSIRFCDRHDLEMAHESLRLKLSGVEQIFKKALVKLGELK